MPVILDVDPTISHQTFPGMLLSGQTYDLELRYNETCDSWFLTVTESAGRVPVIIGRRVAVGVYIGRQSGHPLFANGAFIAVDTEGGEDPGRYDLGRRVILGYWTFQELVAEFLSTGQADVP